MAFKSVRAPNIFALIAGAIALLLLGVRGVWTAAAFANHSRVPFALLAASSITAVIFGLALLYVALRKSRFAGTTAVIIGTFLTFGVIADHATALAFGLSDPVSWWTAIDLTIAVTILGSSLFPWSPADNKPAFFWMGLTFATLTLLFGTSVLMVRL